MVRDNSNFKYLMAVIFIASMANSYVSTGQVEQPSRFEVEMDIYDNHFELINGGDQGILLARETETRSKKGDPMFELIHLDTSLVMNWQKFLYIDKFWDFVGHDYYGGDFYMLFKYLRGGSRDFRILKLNMQSGDTTHYKISNLVPIQLTEFEVTNNAALLGGYYSFTPLVVHFDFMSRKSKVLPGIYQPKTELVHLKVDEEKGTFLVIVSEKTYDKRNTLSVKKYTSEGHLISNVQLQPDLDKGLIQGRVAGFERNLSLVSGTYSNKRSSYSRGIFIAAVDHESDQTLKYYNYADFDNFFNYMKAKKRKRVKDRIERKKVRGKKVKFNYRLLVHDIIEKDDQFIMIGEAYYPKYNSPGVVYSSTNYREYGNFFTGYRYTHAVVIGYDKQGNVLWDNSFQIEDVLSYSLDQFVHADVRDDQIVLLYMYNNEIRSKIIKGNEVLEGKSYNAIRLTFDSDELKDKRTDIGGLEAWYDNNFFAYGTQQIKNLTDAGVKLNRRVFFVNKVYYH